MSAERGPGISSRLIWLDSRLRSVSRTDSATHGTEPARAAHPWVGWVVQSRSCSWAMGPMSGTTRARGTRHGPSFRAKSNGMCDNAPPQPQDDTYAVV